MDPLTAFQVAAAAAQFASTALHISQRLVRYARQTIELPDELKDANERVRLLRSCLVDTEAQLRNQPDLYSEEALRSMNDFVTRLVGKADKLGSILDSYLPADGDATHERIVKALKSLSKDESIASITASMTVDVNYLTLRQTVRSGDAAGKPSKYREPGPGQVISNYPSRRAQHFVPRDGLLEKVDGALRKCVDAEPHVAVLQGMGGQGKTQLALEYCRTARRDLSFSGIFWVDAADEMTCSKSFSAISQTLNPDQSFTDSESRIRYAKITLSSWKNSWLIVFDNYDDPGAYDISEFYPSSPNGFVLITTRSPRTSRLGTMMEVPGMTEDESLNLLFQPLGDRNSRDERSLELGKEIVQRLGYLPLTISQASAYIAARRHRHGLEGFITYFESYMEDVLTSNGQVQEYLDLADTQQQKDNLKNVIKTWNMSLGLLKNTRNADDKITVLSVMGFLSIHDISEELFTSYYSAVTSGKGDVPSWLRLFQDRRGGWSSSQFEDLMLQFKMLSLISTTEMRESDSLIHVSLHPLVRDWLVLRLDAGTHEQVLGLASDMLAYTLLKYRWGVDHALNFGFRMDPDHRRTLLSHLQGWEKAFWKRDQEGVTVVPRYLPDCRSTTIPMTAEMVAADFYQDNGLFDRAESFYRWIWRQADEANPTQLVLKANAGHWLVITLGLSGALEKAFAEARSNLEYWQAANAPQNTIDDCIYNLSMLYSTGVPGFEPELVDRLKSTIDRVSRDPAKGLKHDIYRTELAVMLSWNGDYEGSGEMLTEVYKTSEARGGSTFRLQSWCLRQWSAIKMLPELAVRERLTAEYLDAMRQHFGGDHVFCFHGKQDLAEVLRLRGEHARAVEILQETTRELQRQNTRETMLPDHRKDLGDTFILAGQTAEGVAELSRAMAAYVDAGVLDEPGAPKWLTMVDMYCSMANGCSKLEDWPAAHAHGKQGLVAAQMLPSSSEVRRPFTISTALHAGDALMWMRWSEKDDARKAQLATEAAELYFTGLVAYHEYFRHQYAGVSGAKTLPDLRAAATEEVTKEQVALLTAALRPADETAGFTSWHWLALQFTDRFWSLHGFEILLRWLVPLAALQRVPVVAVGFAACLAVMRGVGDDLDMPSRKRAVADLILLLDLIAGVPESEEIVRHGIQWCREETYLRPDEDDVTVAQTKKWFFEQLNIRTNLWRYLPERDTTAIFTVFSQQVSLPALSSQSTLVASDSERLVLPPTAPPPVDPLTSETTVEEPTLAPSRSGEGPLQQKKTKFSVSKLLFGGQRSQERTLAEAVGASTPVAASVSVASLTTSRIRGLAFRGRKK